MIHLHVEQFKGELQADQGVVKAQTQQLCSRLQEESKGVLDRAGLESHFQLGPALNLINIPSEPAPEKSLRLLEEVDDRIATRGSAFLSEEELRKLTEFQAKTINGDSMPLGLNRMMLAPGAP